MTGRELFIDQLYVTGSILLLLLSLVALQLYYRYFLKRNRPVQANQTTTAVMAPQEIKPVKVMPQQPKPVKTKPVPPAPLPVECGGCGKIIKSPPISANPTQYKCEHCGATVA